jgi:hypothetical protein
MTTMAEIEKAVDEYRLAIMRLDRDVYCSGIGLPHPRYVKDAEDKKQHLMQLIERLAQYQPREVSNDRT